MFLQCEIARLGLTLDLLSVWPLQACLPGPIASLPPESPLKGCNGSFLARASPDLVPAPIRLFFYSSLHNDRQRPNSSVFEGHFLSGSWGPS